MTTFQEPVAAAFHLYHNGFQPGEHIAVYDLGGGTFDAAILERDVTREPEPGQVIRPPFRVIATVGNPKIGGEKFDDELWDLLGSGDLRGAPAWAALQDESRPDPTTDEPSFLDWLVGRRRLRQAIIDLKIDLSTRDQAAVYVPNIALPQTITRTQLEEVLLPYLSSTVDLLLKLIERNELTHSDIVHVALVGGSSQIPLVRRLLAERGRFDYARVSAPGSAQAVVALGAAALAETKSPRPKPSERSTRRSRWTRPAVGDRPSRHTSRRSNAGTASGHRVPPINSVNSERDTPTVSCWARATTARSPPTQRR